MWLDLGLISKSLGWVEGYGLGILSRGNVEMVGRGKRSVLGVVEYSVLALCTGLE